MTSIANQTTGQTLPRNTIYSLQPQSATIHTSGNGLCSTGAGVPAPDCAFGTGIVNSTTPIVGSNQNIGGGTGATVTGITMWLTKQSSSANVTSMTIDFRIVASDALTLRADIGQVTFNPSLCNAKLTGNPSTSILNGQPYCVVSTTNPALTYQLAKNDIVGAICVTQCNLVVFNWGQTLNIVGWTWYDGGPNPGFSIYQVLTGKTALNTNITSSPGLPASALILPLFAVGAIGLFSVQVMERRHEGGIL